LVNVGFFDKSALSPPRDNRSSEVIDCLRRSQDWLKANYWNEWERTFRNYKCEALPFLDPNDKTKEDTEQTAIGMPDTWGLVRRFVARVTAQPPSHRFISQDLDRADRITRTLMWQWDRGGKQKVQKKHVLQAAIFGWSVQAWYWCIEETQRKRRVKGLDPNWQKQIFEQYGEKLAGYMTAAGIPEGVDASSDPNISQMLSAKLMEDVGKGGLIPIQYLFKYYEGPKADFLFIGDCYPEPAFQDLESSRWFCVERRRNMDWLEKFVAAYGKEDPDIAKNADELLIAFPNGSTKNNTRRVPGNLRTRLLSAANRTDVSLLQTEDAKSVGPEWTFVERHVGGSSPRIEYVAENGFWIGSIPYPYDLEGKIAFTELKFIDDLLSGIGDSTARMVRGLNELHNNQVSKREDLIYNLLRPLVGTTDSNLYDNPELMKRGKGFRLVHTTKGPGGIWVMGEQAALAAASASYNDESSLARAFQTASGETNMSMGANVDPQQARTATGAKIMAFNGDILTREQVDMLTTALRDDLEMMRLLNRGELTEDVQVNSDQYRRNFGGGYAAPAPENATDPSQAIINASPEDFQDDGDIEVEVGSTLSDDDDTKLSRAQMLFGMATQAPGLFNVEKARDEMLNALGKGKDRQQWMPPPPPPPPPQEIKTNLSVSMKLEDQPPAVQVQVLSKAGIISPQPEPPEAQVPGMPPGPQAPAGPVNLPAPPEPQPFSSLPQ